MRPLVLCLALFGLAVPVSAQPYTLFPDVRYAATPGVEEALQRLDVYRPLGEGPFPVVVFVHGGAWYTGDKRSSVYEKATWLTEGGIALVSVNYRLSPKPTASPDPDRITFPVHPEDVGRAIAFVLDNAETWDLDASRLALMGHSAGAHLAALVGLDARFLTNAGAPAGTVGCVVALDTHAYDIPFYLANEAGALSTRVYENAFTASPDTQAEASPIMHVGGSSEAAFLLVRQDDPSRAVTTARFRDGLAEGGHDVTEFVAAGLDHRGINTDLGTDRQPEYNAAVAGALAQCFGTSTGAAEPPREAGEPGVSPNPSSGIVRLAVPASERVYRVAVFDARGRRVLRTRTRTGEVDLGALPDGVYLVVARSQGRAFRQRVTLAR